MNARRYAPRHLSQVARRLQLMKAAAAECDRLRDLEEDGADDTAVVAFESMKALVFGNDSEERTAL